MSTTVNATHRKRLARALAAEQGSGYLTALDQVTKAATAGLLPARLDDAGMAAALRILTNPNNTATSVASPPRLSTHVTVQETLEALPGRKKAADPRDQQIFDLSAVYEAWTGKQGLMYISSPSGGKDRYVFGSVSGGGHVCLGREEALTHIMGLVDNATPPASATSISEPSIDAASEAERLHLEKPYLWLLRQAWQGRVTLVVDAITRTRTTPLTVSDKARIAELEAIRDTDMHTSTRQPAGPAPFTVTQRQGWTTGQYQEYLTLTQGKASAVTHFAIDDEKAGDKQEIELRWLLDNRYVSTPPLIAGEEWALVQTTDFGDEVLAFHGADTDKFTDGLPGQEKRTGPRINVIKHSDMARCPITSMSAEHYNDDDTCKCLNPDSQPGPTLDPATDRLMGGPTTTKVYDSHNRRVNATCDVCNRRLKTGEQWWMVHSPNRNWENNAGVSCGEHDPAALPLHTVGDDQRAHADQVARMAAETVHAARPNEAQTHCAVCFQRVRKIQGGQGPTWVHSESGAVAAAGGDPEHPLSRKAAAAPIKPVTEERRTGAEAKCTRCDARVRWDGQKWTTIDEPLGECLVGLGREHRVAD